MSLACGFPGIHHSPYQRQLRDLPWRGQPANCLTDEKGKQIALPSKNLTHSGTEP
jgi:hypothetical protein